ncbi:hypothetical protein [Epibacterium ulvae]|uniref:hypothetical protein n=1 Tax=Epibacterium ulvae TaxID=1156985 RepID=UPI00248F8360|nr:hypothetical protein [Epibacterium ulvae]
MVVRYKAILTAFLIFSSELSAEIFFSGTPIQFQEPYPHSMTTYSTWTETAYFEGVRLGSIGGVCENRKTVNLLAENGYRIELQCADIERYNPLLAFRMNGEDLPTKFGKAFLVWPRREGALSFAFGVQPSDDWRWIWSVTEVD